MTVCETGVCYECHKTQSPVLLIGKGRKYERDTALLCWGCMEKARTKLAKEKGQSDELI
jgi:hypothetical protein